jgi:hypothetical protein
MNWRVIAPVMLIGVPVAAACGSSSPSTQAQATVVAPGATASPTTTTSTTAPPPHFDTPKAAMTYLAAAWNNNDLVSLMHVTNPAARAQLDAMHSEATNLRLDHCDQNPAGDYTCYFKHDYPAGYIVPPGAAGEAIFLVGPADTPGWYMTVFKSCG